MDCEACTDRLVELLYEELPDADADATRAHLSGCEACSQAFAQIRAGKGLAAMLEMAEPPASVLDAVMAAARERVADRAPAQEPAHERPATAPRPDDEESSGPWAAFLKWVGGFAMRPQLAMALTLLLIVGLGMWYLPTLRQSDPADSHAIVDPAPGDEAGPSTSLVPAEPLDLEADPRTGRIRTREDEAAEDRVAAVRPAPPAPTPEPAPEGAGERSVPPPSPAHPEGLAAGDPAGSPGEVVEEALPDPRIAELDVAPGETAPLAPQPQPRPAVRPVAPTIATEVETAPIVTAPAPPPTGDRYREGLQHYRERNYGQAAEDFESVIARPGPDPRVIPSALHHLARSQRAGGNCAAAVRTYERLLAQHPGYSGTGEAMIEGAGCYQRIGRLDDARRLLERARSVPSVASQAQRMLVVLAQQERGREAVDEASDYDVSSAPPPQ